MLRKTHLTLVVIMLLAPLFLMAQKEIKKTFTGVKKIRMNTASGNCEIQKSPTSTVTVGVVYTYEDNEYQPSFSQEGDYLVIKEKFQGNNSRGKADWKVLVPDNIDIQFTTGSGNIEAANLSTTLKVTTGSGNLTFTELKGEISGNTGSGNVELEQVNGIIEATSGSGNFNVAKSKGELTLTSGSGTLRLSDSDGEFTITTGSGHIKGNGMTLSGVSSFTTGSGNAEVTLAATPQHDLSITSGSGSAGVDFNGNEVKGKIVMKASKKHGKIVAPFAFDKTEEIAEWKDNVTVQKTVVRGSEKPVITISTGSGDATLKN